MGQKETSLKDISYLELWQPLCSMESNKFVKFEVEGIMRNNYAKLFRIWTSGSGGNVIKRHFLSRALAAP